MRESFVFHEDFICDLPESYKLDFMRYTIEYGLYGTVPPLDEGTLEYSLWKKIARRIDSDFGKYKEISDKRKEAAQKRHQSYYQRSKENLQTESHVHDETSGENSAGRKSEQAKPEVTNFTKPTVDEIREYCEERKNGVDAQNFYDFYESKGWKVGAVKMKDWRASIRTWERRKKNEATGGRNKQGAMWGNENDIPDEIINMM